jgi:rod shape-determining protein MreC
MRLRKRHAWGGVLVFLFALPVLKPGGFPAIEGWVDGVLAWPARSGLGVAKASAAATSSSRGSDPRVAVLERRIIGLTADHYDAMEAIAQRLDLKEALVGLDRVPASAPARILRSRDPSPNRRSVLLDRGSEDGFATGCAVAQGRTFLGIVAHVQAKSARVQLLTDPYSRLEVAIRTQEGQRAVAFLRGEAAETLRLRHLRSRPGLVVRPGDPVVTSNAVPNVPAGLLVGEVSECGDPDADGVLDVRVRPLADLERSTSVLVFLPSPPTR